MEALRDGMVGGDGGLGWVVKAAVMADKNAVRSSEAKTLADGFFGDEPRRNPYGVG